MDSDPVDDSHDDSDFKPDPGDKSRSSSADSVPSKRSKKRILKKKKKQTVTDKSSQFWDVSDVVLVEEFSDPFLFVDEDGKMARNKYMADTKEHKGSQFTLVYSEMSSWDKFVASSSKASKADPLSTFYIVSKVPKVTKKMKFDALMWVRSELVSDVPMERWYLLLEIYQNPKLKLHQYLHPKPAAANKDKQDSQDNVSSSKPSKSRCSGTPPSGTSNSRCSGAPNDNPGGPVDAPSENMDGDVNVPILTSNPVTTCSGSGDTNSVKSNSKFNFKRVGVAPEKFVKEKESKNTVKNTNVIERLFTKFLEDVHPEMPSDFISLEEKDIPDLVSEFFMMLQKNEEQSYNESTLLTYYYSLSRLFLEKKNIVVKNNPLFEGTRKVLRAQQKVSRENGEIPGKNASRAIPPEVLAKCWEKEVFGKKDPQTLQATVLLNHQIYFGVRAKKETVDTRVGDVSCGPLRSDGLPQYLEYSERVTKTRTGATGQGARESIPRMYPDDARPDRCPVRLFDFFMSKKPAEARKPDFRLFVNALNITKKKWEDCDVWYAAAPMGHNTIGGLIKKQLEAAGINTKDLKLTGTSVRKTGIDGSMSSGVPGSYVSMMFGQKNLASKISYMSQTDATQKATNIVLQNVVSGEASSSPLFKDIYDGERKNKSKPEELTFTSPSNNLESTNDAPSCSSSKKKKKKKRKEKVETSSSSSSSDTDSSDDEKSKKKLKKLRKKIKKLEQMKQPTFPQPGYPQPSFPQPGYPQPSFPQPGYPQPSYPQPSYPQPGYPQPSYPYAVQMMPPPYQMVHILPNNYPQAEAVKLPQQQVLTRTLTQTQTLGPANNNYLVDEIDNRN